MWFPLSVKPSVLQVSNYKTTFSLSQDGVTSSQLGAWRSQRVASSLWTASGDGSVRPCLCPPSIRAYLCPCGFPGALAAISSSPEVSEAPSARECQVSPAVWCVPACWHQVPLACAHEHEHLGTWASLRVLVLSHAVSVALAAPRLDLNASLSALLTVTVSS